MRRLRLPMRSLDDIINSMYIYQLKNWPKFLWNYEHIANLLTQIRYKQGLLIGEMESIGFPVLESTVLQNLTQDVIKSSEIEGELLDYQQVRSSVARHLGMDIGGLETIDQNVEGVVEMILDATQNHHLPLDKTRILNWHALLFPTGQSDFKKIKVGAWRSSSVQVVSGHWGKEKIHFEGPPAEKVNSDMELLCNWLNDAPDMDLVLKAAIAHLWFVTIHPFEDGNGRIGRAIVDYLLARSENSPHRFYSLSSQIQRERKSYYTVLEKTQKGNLDITDWLEWFLNCLRHAIEGSLSSFKIVLQKSQFWDALKEEPLNERQRKIVSLLLEGFEGKLTTTKWAKITKCSQDTAYRDILNLLNRGILIKSQEGGRSTSYSLKILALKNGI